MPLFYHKIDSLRWIDGSIREDLEPDERSVWADLMALAGLTREPRRGFIERSKGIAYKKAVLLPRLNITEELFDRTVAKCVEEGRLTVLPDGTMHLTNWERYNDMTSYKAKKEAKEIAIGKSKQTRETKDNIMVALLRSVNRLNQGLEAHRYEVTKDNKILDTKTGEIKEIGEIEKGVSDG